MRPYVSRKVAEGAQVVETSMAKVLKWSLATLLLLGGVAFGVWKILIDHRSKRKNLTPNTSIMKKRFFSGLVCCVAAAFGTLFAQEAPQVPQLPQDTALARR